MGGPNFDRLYHKLKPQYTLNTGHDFYNSSWSPPPGKSLVEEVHYRGGYHLLLFEYRRGTSSFVI